MTNEIEKVEAVAEKATECVAEQGCAVIGISPAVVPDAIAVIADLQALLATPQCQALIVALAKLGADFGSSAAIKAK